MLIASERTNGWGFPFSSRVSTDHRLPFTESHAKPPICPPSV